MYIWGTAVAYYLHVYMYVWNTHNYYSLISSLLFLSLSKQTINCIDSWERPRRWGYMCVYEYFHMSVHFDQDTDSHGHMICVVHTWSHGSALHSWNGAFPVRKGMWSHAIITYRFFVKKILMAWEEIEPIARPTYKPLLLVHSHKFVYFYKIVHACIQCGDLNNCYDCACHYANELLIHVIMSVCSVCQLHNVATVYSCIGGLYCLCVVSEVVSVPIPSS